MPSLLIAGDWDKSASLGGCLEIYKRTGGRKYIDVIEGMGHWHCVEEPERVGKAIGFFVEQVIEDNAVEKS